MTDFTARLKNARHAMKQAGLGGLLLTGEPSVYYFSGTVSSRPPGLIISADPATQPVLICRKVEQDAMAAMTNLEVLGAEREAAPMLLSVFGQLGLAKETIGFEDNVLTFEAATSLMQSLNSIKLTPASKLVRQLRLVKDAEEIQHMRKAGQVSDLAMMAAVNALKAGKNESLAAAAAESTMREHGMFIAYETLIGSGSRSGMLRRFPNLQVPKPDDIIKIDLAAKLSFASGYGYHTDQTRSITTGKPSQEKLDALTAVQQVQEATLKALKPGRTIRQVGLDGLSVVKGTKFESAMSMSGHGIGLDIHEWPNFGIDEELTLMPGQCYAIEPHLSMPKYTTCMEDTIVVTQTGYERITKLPYELWG